jgi:hypothetical protein
VVGVGGLGLLGLEPPPLLPLQVKTDGPGTV